MHTHARACIFYCSLALVDTLMGRPRRTNSSRARGHDPQTKHTSFWYQDECCLNLSLSPFGICSVILKVPHQQFVGLGATANNISCTIEDGKVFYNDERDFAFDDTIRYSITVYTDPVEEVLRVDLFKVDINDEKVRGMNAALGLYDFHGLIDQIGEGGQIHQEEPPYADKLRLDEQLRKLQAVQHEVPDIVFMGKIKEYARDVEPSVGILKFEKLET